MRASMPAGWAAQGGRHNRPMPTRLPPTALVPALVPALMLALMLALLGGCTAPIPRPAPVPQAAPIVSPAPLPPRAAELPAPAAAPPFDANAPAGFHAWLREFAEQARAQGTDQATLDATLARARWRPDVLALDRAQPEFTRTPWAYLDSAVSPARVQQGRAMRARHHTPLQAAAERYGVPGEIIAAIWGMESNYGQFFGDIPTVDALATLAFDGRRRHWAEHELLAALAIVQQGDIAAGKLRGSWAGAMGHTQFLPSVFLRYAVDADGDGRRDIWASVADATASTAHFLAQAGWRAHEPWGAEVLLPAGFDWRLAEPGVRRDSAAWAALGLRRIDAAALPALADASLLAPAGAQGPVLLAGANFRVLLRYNRSDNYALAVGLLAQQIAGGPGLRSAWPREEPAISHTEAAALQQALNARGLDAGAVDGVLGPATRAALRRLQQALGLAPDGFASDALLRLLSIR